MAWIRAVVEDEFGNRRGEGFDFSVAILPPVEDARYTCLRFVDPYGNTVFNHVQLPFFLDDLHLRMASLDRSDLVAALQQIEQLALNCLQGVHLYLKLIGD